MEMVLDVYKRTLDPRYPVVCMDESPKQLIAETKTPISASPGQPARHDYEYKRCGVCNIFMACEPLAGKRMVKITERKTKQDWALFLEEIASYYQEAPKHGSWLNIAEIELNVLIGQCLNRRIDDIDVVRKESSSWQEFRNNKGAKVNWQFRSEDARIKLTRLYPTLDV